MQSSNVAHATQVFCTAAVSSIIFVWFYRLSFDVETLGFAGELSMGFSFTNVSIFFDIVFIAIIVASKMNRIPHPARVLIPVACSALFLVRVLLSYFGFEPSYLVTPIFIVECILLFWLRILWYESYLRMGTLRSVAEISLVAFALFYPIQALVVSLPTEAQVGYLVLAPLVLLPFQFDREPLPAPMRACGRTQLQSYVACVLLIVLAGGLITVDGESLPADSVANALSDPSPFFCFVSHLVFAVGFAPLIYLSIPRLVALPAIACAWNTTSFIGNAIGALIPGIPSDFLSLLGVFLLFAGILMLVVDGRQLVPCAFDAGGNVAKSVAEDVATGEADSSEKSDRVFRKKQAVENAAEQCGLTNREKEVLLLLIKGRNVPFIMESLCLSEATVRTHISHIYQKLGIHSRQELLDLFFEANRFG